MRGLYFVLFIVIVSLCQCKDKDSEFERQNGEYKNGNNQVLTKKRDIALLKKALEKMFSVESACCGSNARELFSFLPPAERKQLVLSTLERVLSRDTDQSFDIVSRVDFLCHSEFDEFIKSGRFSAYIWAAIRAKKDSVNYDMVFYLPKVEQRRIYEELAKLQLEELNACTEKCVRMIWRLFGFAHYLSGDKGVPFFREVVKKAIKYGDALTAKLAKKKLGGELDDAELQEAYENCVTLYEAWQDCAGQTGEDIDRLKLSDKQRQELFIKDAENCQLGDLDARYAKVFHKQLSDENFYKMVEHCIGEGDFSALGAVKALAKRRKKQ